MAKPYIPVVTVDMIRAFDGKVERSKSITLRGDKARELEKAVSALIALALEPDNQNGDA
jgi:hypothetical protein